MGKPIDISGQRFGRLVAIKPVSKAKRGVIWECRCDCGNKTYVDCGKLRSMETRSCGCMQRDSAKMHFYKHGNSRERLHKIWEHMIMRCDPSSKFCRDNYGGRGISVCDEWKGEDGYLRFKEWALNNGYTDALSIDRINNDGNYEPENCRWATNKQQANNRRSNVVFEFNGEKRTLAEWADLYEIPYGRLNDRIRSGMPIEKALYKGIFTSSPRSNMEATE